MSSKSWITPAIKQAWVSSGPLFSKIGAGMAHGFASAVLAYVKKPDATIKMSLEMISWFVSSLLISGILGNIIAGFLIDKYGRRASGLICNIPAVIGGIVIYFATNFPVLMVGRISIGLSVGANVVIATIVVAEYCSPQNRGTFFNIKTAGFNLGNIISHILGNYLEWRYLALLTIIPYFLCIVIAYTSPESPSWLAERHQYDKSKTAFYWLRGRSEDSTREIEELLQSQRNSRVNTSIMTDLVNFVKKLKQKNFIKPTIILIFAFILIETSGRHIFPSYGGQIIEEISSGKFDNFLFYYKLLVDILIFTACILSSYIIRFVKYRTLLFVSGSLTFIVLNVSCLLFYFITNGTISKDYSLIPICLFALFFFLSNIGCSCIPFAWIGELYPLEHRASGATLASNLILVIISITLKVFPAVLVKCETYGAFALLALAMGVSLVILYFTVPETKDRTLLEIEEYFNNGKFRDGVVVPTDDECNDRGNFVVTKRS